MDNVHLQPFVQPRWVLLFIHRHLLALESFHAVRCPARNKDGRISRLYDTGLPIKSDATSAFDHGDVFVVVLVFRAF